METTELDAVGFEETFGKEWLSSKLRQTGQGGGVEAILIPVTAGGYVLPQRLASKVEPYIVHRYRELAGGRSIIETEEKWYIDETDKTRMKLKAVALVE